MRSIASICDGLTMQAFRALWVLFDLVSHFACLELPAVLHVLFFVLS